MKTVYFIRHAKSSWENPGLRDKDRPLNRRGKRDAPFMAKLLKGDGTVPDKLISSPANRALSTATYFAEIFDLQASDIWVVDSIYEAHPDEIIDIVRHLSDEWNIVFIFGHNPTLTEVVNHYTDRYIANIPTCGIAHIDDPVEKWESFGSKNATLAEFYYPKQYLD